jgi:hypothetical protein
MNARSEAWFDSQRELMAFATALGNAGELDGWIGALSFVERPWRWDEAYQAWCHAGRPKSFAVPR